MVSPKDLLNLYNLKMKCLSQCHIDRICAIFRRLVGEKIIFRIVSEGDYATFDIKIFICKIQFNSLLILLLIVHLKKISFCFCIIPKLTINEY